MGEIGRSQRFRSIRKIYVSLALHAFNFVVLFALLNAVLWTAFEIDDTIERRKMGRARGALRYQKPLLEAAYEGRPWTEIVSLLTETRGRPFKCNPYTHYLESPFKGDFVNVTEFGLRSNSRMEPWPPPNGKSVVGFVFGGSTTFGYGVSDGETIPSYLQEFFDQSNSKETHIYNFGQGSFYSSQELALFVNLIRAGFVPDFAIFIDGLNEIGHPNDRPDYLGICASQREQTFELPVLRFARFIREKIRENSHTNSTYRNDSDPEDCRGEPEIAVKRWMKNREIILGIARELDIDVFFVWQPVPVYKSEISENIFYGAITREMKSCLSEQYRVMAALEAEWSQWGRFLYLADVQVGRKRLLYIDRVHYSPDFNREIAGMIGDLYLKENRKW